MTTEQRIADARAVMKKCQRGFRDFQIDDSNGLHAECFGTIGGLLHELTIAIAALKKHGITIQQISDTE